MHSGDSACVIPPLSIGPELEAEIRRQTELLVRGLGVQGLCNVQFALHEGTIYVLEANPRASRTVPFVCKAMGIDLVDLACRVTTGSRLAEMNVVIPEPRVVAVKEVVLPFARFPGSDPVLGPGDALDRRGDGARARLRDDVREGDARGRAASAGAAERPPRRRVPLGLRPRQAGRDAARAAARRPRLRPRRDARHGAAHQAARHRRDRGREGGRGRRQLRRRPRARRHASTSSSTRPSGAGRAPTATRSGAPRSPPRCRASRRSRVPARRCRRSRGPGRSSPRACRSCTLDGSRAWRRASRSGRTSRSQLERTFPAGAPGQFHMLRALAHDGFLARPLSAVASDDARRHVPLPAARRRRSRRSRSVGAEVDVLGPFGRGFDVAAAGSAPLLVGGGFGAALLAPLARALPGRRAAGRVPRRGRGARRRARARGRARDRAPARQRARAAGAAPRALRARPRRRARRARARRGRAPARRRASPCQVALEAPMACGYGACYGCAVRLDGQLVRLCVEGPVVAGARLAAA